ncbi:MAG: hypothetical protein IT515_02530 [Burkholderiales bacterium]|nr:hypothetical protein [Burkholderiales bacterium]
MARQLVGDRGNGAVLADPRLHGFLYPWTGPGEIGVTSDRRAARPAGGPGLDRSPGPVKPEEISFGVRSRTDEDGRVARTLTLKGGEGSPHMPELAMPASAFRLPGQIHFEYRQSGKWYWEARFHEKRSSAPLLSDVGINNPRPRDHLVSAVAGFTRPAKGPIPSGTTLQFALDIDRGRLFLGVDGAWLDGDPSSAAGGTSIPPNAHYAPAAEVRAAEKDPYESDVLTFNFGATPFRYRMPEGFEPYDFRFRDQRHDENALAATPHVATVMERLDLQTEALVRDAAGVFAPTIAEALWATYRAWVNYRNRACILTGAYRASSRTVRDPACLNAFNASLADRLAWVTSMVPRPRANEDVPAFDRSGAKLHYLRIYGSGNERRPVDVRVTDSSAPLVLVLDGYHPHEWRLALGLEVILRQVLLFGQYRQTAMTGRANVPVSAYSSEEKNYSKIWSRLSKAQESHLDLADVLQELVGLAPSSMQFDCPESGCVIDGKRSWRHQSVSVQTGQPVGWILQGRPVPTGQRVENLGRGPGETVHASEARNSGKWYFEVHAAPLPAGKKTWAGGTVGVVDASRSSKGADLLYRDSVTAGRARRIEPGQVVSVALDLEEGRVYFGIEGKWIVGDPTEGRDGKPLKKGRDYYPAIQFYSRDNVALERRLPREEVEGGTWLGRFEAPDFAYAMPPGYRPYQSLP